MPITIEVSARDVNTAIEEGLAKLNKTIDDVDVKILAQRGLFRKAKVQLTVIGAEDELPVEIKEKAKPEVKPAAYGKRVFDNKDEKPVEKEEKPVGEKSDFERSPRPKREKPFRQDRPQRERPARQEKPFAPKPESERKPREDQQPRKREEKVYTAITDEVKQQAIDYVDGLVKKMGVEGEITHEIKDNELFLNIVTDNSAVIGYRGETLDSIEYLVGLAINKDENTYYKVSVNSNGYREKREAMLVDLANKMAAKCIKQNRKVVLEPMNNSGRKIIHAALSDNDKVVTRSEGHEPNRRVVIFAVRNKK